MEWRKIASHTFELIGNGQVIGTLQIEATSSSWHFGGSDYRFQLKNSWKQKYQLIDADGQVVGEMRPKNWYGTTSILTINDQQYSLKYTNNPLAGIQLLDADGHVLVQARLITTDGRAKTEFIMETNFMKTTHAFWLASIIWTHFYPIAQSECGDLDVATFLLLTTA